MEVVDKYTSEIYVNGKDWHAGICFYTLVFMELEIYDNNLCRLTTRIFLDKSSGGIKQTDSSWHGDLNEMKGTKYILLKPEKESNQELKIWFEKVPKQSDWIFLDILRPDYTGEFKYSQELVLKKNNNYRQHAV